jgi:hypothetical protein
VAALALLYLLGLTLLLGLALLPLGSTQLSALALLRLLGSTQLPSLALLSGCGIAVSSGSTLLLALVLLLSLGLTQLPALADNPRRTGKEGEEELADTCTYWRIIGLLGYLVIGLSNWQAITADDN